MNLPRAVERALREWQLIEERRRAEQELRESEERFRILFATAPDPIIIHDADGLIVDGNRAAEELLGRPRAKVVGQNLLDLGIFSAHDEEVARARLADQRRGRETGPDEFAMKRPDGSVVDVEVRTVPLVLQGRSLVLVIARDISARKQADRTRRRLEEQLHQAMKMDAIGRLAGGVAHDFNNLLTAISSYTQLLLGEVRPGDPMQADLLEIKRAAERAASLTSQLLAFGRKQVITPTLIDINDHIRSSSRMLERLIGEHVQLSADLGIDVGTIRADAAQLDQILLNLAVNARDAMPEGGVVMIDTRRTLLDEAGRAIHLDARAGPYLRLTVRDSGRGMSAETLERLFEPFFTTKEKGSGTGLGLSIVYGIVKQNGGFIVVSSDVGTGSAFEVYLPSADAAVASEKHDRPALPVGRNETILLVEDDVAVLRVTERFLRGQGYTVIATDRPLAAEGLLAEAQGGVDLLLTDVLMPALNGRKLWDRLKQTKPGLRALFMSGHTDDVLGAQGILEPGIHFLQKPFSLDGLATKVREALDALDVSAAPRA